jgi:hypothetical protein
VEMTLPATQDHQHGNDSKQYFSMVELAKSNHIKIILCSVLPANYFYWSPKERPADAIISLNTSIKRYATANNIPYVDYYRRWLTLQRITSILFE